MYTTRDPGESRVKIREWSGRSSMRCVFIHGAAEGSFVWDAVINALAGQLTMAAVDLRGHGEAPWDQQGFYRFSDFCDDVELYLKSISTDPFVLVGHSLGGDIALWLAARFSSALAGLVLVDTGPGVNEREGAQMLKQQLRASCKLYNSVDEYFDWLQERRFLTPADVLRCLATNSLRKRLEGGFTLKFDPRVIDVIDAGPEDTWYMKGLAQLNVPCLIIRGRGSAILSPVVAEEMRKLLNQGRLATVDRAGHAVMNDNIDGFLGELSPFLDRFIR